MKRTLFTLAILWCGVTQATGFFRCIESLMPHTMGVRDERGREVLMELAPKGTELYQLGEGGAGAVYRVIAGGIERTYKVFSSLEVMKTDLFGLQELHRAYPRSLQSNGFRVVDMKEVIVDLRDHRFIAEVSNVRGVDLGKALDKNWLSPEDRAHWIQLYLGRRKDWERRLRSLGYRSIGAINRSPYDSPWGLTLPESQHPELQLIVRPESVVVDLKSLEMTIFDPK